MSRRTAIRPSDPRLTQIQQLLTEMEQRAQAAAQDRAAIKLKLAAVEEARDGLKIQCETLTQDLQALRTRVSAVERRTPTNSTT